MRSMSIREKFAVVDSLQNLKATVESFDGLIDSVCTVVHSIDGHADVKKALNGIEDFVDLQTIINDVISYCTLGIEEEKNSDSSLDTSTPSPTGEN